MKFTDPISCSGKCSKVVFDENLQNDSTWGEYNLYFVQQRFSKLSAFSLQNKFLGSNKMNCTSSLWTTPNLKQKNIRIAVSTKAVNYRSIKCQQIPPESAYTWDNKLNQPRKQETQLVTTGIRTFTGGVCWHLTFFTSYSLYYYTANKLWRYNNSLLHYCIPLNVHYCF